MLPFIHVFKCWSTAAFRLGLIMHLQDTFLGSLRLGKHQVGALLGASHWSWCGKTIEKHPKKQIPKPHLKISCWFLCLWSVMICYFCVVVINLPISPSKYRIKWTWMKMIQKMMILKKVMMSHQKIQRLVFYCILRVRDLSFLAVCFHSTS